MSEDLTGKVALVTGASRGIGRAIALALGNAGADVAVNFLDQEPEAKELAAQIAQRGRRAMVVHADVSIKADVLKMIEAIEAQLGAIDILVNNAGISQSKPIAE